MSGNTIGNLYKITTFGESHGEALGAIVDGCPSNLKLDLEQIQYELYRRKPGQSRMATSRKEEDILEVLSGLDENGYTLGTPIAMVVKNADAVSGDYDILEDKFRPGHADHTYFEKYGINDHRGGGRASGRETLGRVLGGAVAKQILSGIRIIGYTANVGGIEVENTDFLFIEENDLRFADRNHYQAAIQKVLDAKAANDSIGGAVDIIIKNVPIGWGEPVFDKLDAELAKAFMSIGAVKAVSFGRGREVEHMRGSEYNDMMNATEAGISYLTNNSGGIIGGISNGEDITARLSVKPTPTRCGVELSLPTKERKNEDVVLQGRHDSVIMPRLVPVAEAMAAIVLVDFMLFQKAYSK